LFNYFFYGQPTLNNPNQQPTLNNPNQQPQLNNPNSKSVKCEHEEEADLDRRQSWTRRKLAQRKLDAEEARRGGSWTRRKLAQRKLDAEGTEIGKIRFSDLGVLENREHKKFSI